MHAFVVLGLVFPYQAKRLAWGTPSQEIGSGNVFEMTCLVWSGT